MVWRGIHWPGMDDPEGTEATTVAACEKACEWGLTSSQMRAGRARRIELPRVFRGVFAAKPRWHLAALGDQGLYLVYCPKLPAGAQAHLPALPLVPLPHTQARSHSNLSL